MSEQEKPVLADGDTNHIFAKAHAQAQQTTLNALFVSANLATLHKQYAELEAENARLRALLVEARGREPDAP